MRVSLLKVVGGLAVVAISFLATDYFLNRQEAQNTPAMRDARRMEDARKLKEAIRNYRAARNVFPSDLKLLVDGGYLSSIPADPIWANTKQRYQYYSNEVNNFGLLVWLEERHGN